MERARGEVKGSGEEKGSVGACECRGRAWRCWGSGKAVGEWKIVY